MSDDIDAAIRRLILAHRERTAAEVALLALAGFEPSGDLYVDPVTGQEVSREEAALRVLERATERRQRDRRAMLAQCVEMFAQAFPGGILVDTSRGSHECPELRVGPFRDSRGAWAVVRYADGRRAIRDIGPQAVVFAAGRDGH